MLVRPHFLRLLLIAPPLVASHRKALHSCAAQPTRSWARAASPTLAAVAPAPPEGFEWGSADATETPLAARVLETLDELNSNIDELVGSLEDFTPTFDGLVDWDLSEQRRRKSERRRKLLRGRSLRATQEVTPLWVKCRAEALGTAFIALVGMLATSRFGAGLTVALAWGAAVGIAVSAGAKASGAHYNPAVTLALVAGNSFSWRHACAYIPSQLAGAALATAVHSLWFPMVACPALAAPIVAEMTVTAVLLYVCLAIADGVASGRVARRVSSALVGALICSINLLFASLGAGINPALSLAPRVIAALSGHGSAALAGSCSYCLGPILGGVLGGCVFALGSGRGEGVYSLFARTGRLLSPWYGEHWERLTEPAAPPSRRALPLTSPFDGVVVPTKLRVRPYVANRARVKDLPSPAAFARGVKRERAKQRQKKDTA